MPWLLDTNILIRLTNQGDAHHAVASQAVTTLHARGELLHLTPQTLVEFRAVATRPPNVNGLGLLPAEASRRAAIYEAMFPLLDETPAIYPAWRAVADAVGVIGKQVHDARLVAVCHAHAVTHLLTFNVAHFTRTAAEPPGVVVVHPANV